MVVKKIIPDSQVCHGLDWEHAMLCHCAYNIGFHTAVPRIRVLHSDEAISL